MSTLSALAIFFRWLHIVTACITVGGVFFLCLILPSALAALDPESRRATFRHARRIFKRVIHAAILLFLISGIFNAVRALPSYGVQPYQPWMQALLGIHMTLAIVIFVIAIYVLMGDEPPASYKTWMAVNLILLLCTILAASSLKFLRERATLDIHALPAVNR